MPWNRRYVACMLGKQNLSLPAARRACKDKLAHTLSLPASSPEQPERGRSRHSRQCMSPQNHPGQTLRSVDICVVWRASTGSRNVPYEPPSPDIDNLTCCFGEGRPSRHAGGERAGPCRMNECHGGRLRILYRPTQGIAIEHLVRVSQARTEEGISHLDT